MTPASRSLGVLIAAIMMAAGGRADAATAAVALNQPLSVRQLGMGEVSLGTPDALRAWSNPALLPGYEGRGAVALNGGSLSGLGATGAGLAVAWKLTKSWTAGLLASTYSISVPVLDAAGDATSGKTGQTTTAGGIAVAGTLGALTGGLTVKGLSDNVDGASATGAAADLGAAATWGGLEAAVAIRNVGGALRTAAATGATADALPGEVRVGGVYRLAGWRLTGGLEYAQVTGRDGRIGVGAEWWPIEMLGVRAGVSGLSAAQQRITAGLSSAYHGIGFDYAFGLSGPGPAHRVSLSYAFGAWNEADTAEGTKASPAKRKSAKSTAASEQ